MHEHSLVDYGAFLDGGNDTRAAERRRHYAYVDETDVAYYVAALYSAGDRDGRLAQDETDILLTYGYKLAAEVDGQFYVCHFSPSDGDRPFLCHPRLRSTSRNLSIGKPTMFV